MKYVNKGEWEAIVNLMNDETRERVHDELAPCNAREFLARYLELDPEFRGALEQEFGMDRWDSLDGVPDVHSFDSLDMAGKAEEVAARVRESDTWDIDDVYELCKIAKIEAACESEEHIEKLAEGAAHILGVEIY